MNEIQQYSIENCPYRILYIDITHRCNMNCNYCYNPLTTIPDITKQYFEEVCSKIPKTSEIRILGGEPTIHPQIFDFIDITRKYRHIPSVVSNGKMYADKSFVKEMEKHSAIYALSLNGGLTSPNIYKQMDNEDSYNFKMKALDNLLSSDIKRITLNVLVIRNLNEHVVDELIKLGQKQKNIRYLKLRSLGTVGKYINSKPYTTKEFKPILHSFIQNQKINVIRSGLEENCFECCYRITIPNLYISHVEFGSTNSQQCWMRGKIENNFIVEPFFTNMVNHTTYLTQIGYLNN